MSGPCDTACCFLAALALGRPEYLILWRRLNADPTVDEVIRNFFIRQPLLWTSS